MGPLTQILEMIPGMGSAMRQQNVQVSDDDHKHIEAIILSMTPEERRHPEIINRAAQARIASGSGTTRHEVNSCSTSSSRCRR